MREYFVLYAATSASWSIIFRDNWEQTFFLYAEGLSEKAAREIAEAMNAKNGSDT